jgi:exopolysaccharide production protein ExoZ
VLVARLPRRAALGWLIPLGLALLFATHASTGDVESTLEPHFALWRAFAWGIPAALIVWGTLSIAKLFDHRRFDLPVALGDASYSIYLFHPIIAYGFDLPGALRVLLAIGIGWAAHVVVERRLLAARKQWPALVTRLSSRKPIVKLT